MEATVSDDGYTIDLNLAPEVVEISGNRIHWPEPQIQQALSQDKISNEFEGFINYGSPIQTTGVNALGQSEPVVLTDSRILQPVFATRYLADSRKDVLRRILGGLGIADRSGGLPAMAEPFNDLNSPSGPEAKVLFRALIGFYDLGQYDKALEKLTAVRALNPTNGDFVIQLARVEDKIDAAYQQYASDSADRTGPGSGVKPLFLESQWELFGYSWNSDEGTLSVTGSARDRRVAEEVAAAIQESVNSGARLELSAADWLNDKMPHAPEAGLLRKQSGSPLGNANSESEARACRSAVVRLRSGGPGSSVSANVPLPPSRRFDFSPQSDAAMRGRIELEAIGAGFQTKIQLDVPKLPDFLNLAQGVKKFDQASAKRFILPGGDWHRFDYRIDGSGKKDQRLSVFARCTRTTLADE